MILKTLVTAGVGFLLLLPAPDASADIGTVRDINGNNIGEWELP